MVPSAYRKFQMLIITVIDNKEIFMKVRKFSRFYSLGRLNIPVLCSALNWSIAPSIPWTFLTIYNHKTITQSAEIHIFVGETRRSHICSHHVLAWDRCQDKQIVSPGLSKMVQRWSLWGRPPREAECWHHWEMKTVQERIVILEMICLNLRPVKGFYSNTLSKTKGIFC